jgi:hypothetical protein
MEDFSFENNFLHQIGASMSFLCVWITSQSIITCVCSTYTNVRNGESFQLPRNDTLALFWELVQFIPFADGKKILNV